MIMIFSDEVIIMRELIHSFSTSQFKVPAFGLKYDPSEAFDHLRWDYISFVLQCYGIPSSYIP
jgi:hypothetical protein